MLSHNNELANQDKLKRLYKTQQVLVAGRDIPAGTVLDDANVATQSFLINNVSKNALSPQKRNLIIGRTIAVDLLRGDQLLLSTIQGSHGQKDIARRIPPGRRLFTLNIDAKAAGYGFVNPNDHVDIIGHLNFPGRGLTTVTLLQDITLVSVGARSVIDAGKGKGGTDVSFFVTPKQFEILAFAQKQGKFSLSLRNPRDIGRLEKQTDRTSGVDINRFLDDQIINEASGGGALEVIVNGNKKKKSKTPSKG
jgi:pilus assembly protein CpaB